MLVTTVVSLLTLSAESALPAAPQPEPQVEQSLAPAPTSTSAEDVPAPAAYTPGARQRRVGGDARRGIHELRDPTGWPAEPAAPACALPAAAIPDAAEPAPLVRSDRDRFADALTRLCDEVAPREGLQALAGTVFDAALAAKTDPFLIGGLAYSASRCRAGLAGASGVGLLQIQPQMFAASAQLPFPRADLDRARLLDPAHNVRVGAALLAMWDAEHAALDAAAGSTPHRHAVSHLHWGDKVWSATPEDRALTARRRLIELWNGVTPAPGAATLGFTIVPPLDGVPRLGTSGPGADRAGGRRSHKGIDIDANVGEPVRAVAAGVVQFAGLDMPGKRPARALAPEAVSRHLDRRLGPGGVFVRIVHDDGLRTGYFHLASFNVVPGQVVEAGEIIGTVGRSGVKVSPSHLHFEVHQDGDVQDPVAFLGSFVLPPEATLQHDVAMTMKEHRLARLAKRLRRLGRKARPRTSHVAPAPTATPTSTRRG